PYGAFSKWHGRPAREITRRMRVPHLTLRKLKEAAHGIDLGPLRSCLPARLRTADKRIELAPDVLVQDVERVKAKLLNDTPLHSNGDLLLIGRRQLRSNNSWMHNSHRLVKGPPACVLYIHPEDAAARGVVAGGLARIESRVGSIEVPVALTDDLVRGVVSPPPGWVPAREGS